MIIMIGLLYFPIDSTLHFNSGQCHEFEEKSILFSVLKYARDAWGLFVYLCVVVGGFLSWISPISFYRTRVSLSIRTISKLHCKRRRIHFQMPLEIFPFTRFCFIRFQMRVHYRIDTEFSLCNLYTVFNFTWKLMNYSLTAVRAGGKGKENQSIFFIDLHTECVGRTLVYFLKLYSTL